MRATPYRFARKFLWDIAQCTEDVVSYMISGKPPVHNLKALIAPEAFVGVVLCCNEAE